MTYDTMRLQSRPSVGARPPTCTLHADGSLAQGPSEPLNILQDASFRRWPREPPKPAASRATGRGRGREGVGARSSSGGLPLAPPLGTRGRVVGASQVGVFLPWRISFRRRGRCTVWQCEVTWCSCTLYDVSGEQSKHTLINKSVK